MVKVFTNSICDLTPQWAAEYGVTMIPDVIVFSPEEQYMNNLDVDAPTLYRRLASSTQLPTTAHPNLEQCMQAFQTVGEGDEVLCLSPTSKMSGAYNTACSARELLKDQGFTTPITVYDSLQVSFGLAVLAREAGRMAKEGLSAGQIVARLDQLRPKVGVYFVMESLENARRGGRVGAIRVLAADLLKVKPILTFRDGLVRDIGIVRGYANAVERVISLYKSKAQYGGEVFLFHADREDLAQQVKQRILELDPQAQIRIGWVGAVIGVYTGAGCLGLSFTEK